MATLDTSPQTALRDELQARTDRLGHLWQMTPDERVDAMRHGELSLEQLAAWSGRHPEQVPTVNGEFEWIAAFTPEADR